MTALAHPNPNQAQVRAAMDTLYIAEPDALPSSWRPAFDTLSAALDHARGVRNRARIGVAVLAVVVGIVLYFMLWAAPADPDAIALAQLTPLRTEVGWVPRELRVFAAITTIGALVVELAMSKLYAVLGSEDSVVSLLRYFGSKVQDEGTFS